MMAWVDSFCELLSMTTQVIVGGIFCITLLIMIIFLIMFILAGAIQSTIMISEYLLSKTKIRNTNGNKIRRMSDKQMAQYFLQNYREIELYKGRFCGVKDLEFWLKSKDK